MAFVIRDALVGHQPITEISSTQKHPLGQVVCAYDPTYGEGEFIYVQGVASCLRGSVLLIAEDDYSTTLATANGIGRIGFAMGALVASNYGWAQISGKAVAKGLTGLVDNANCYLTGTAGSLDDAVVAGDRIKQCKTASALDTPATGLVEIECDRPYVDDGLTA